MKDLCRRIGISEATFYHWKAKYGGLEVSETRRLRQLEEENGRLKKIVAQQWLWFEREDRRAYGPWFSKSASFVAPRDNQCCIVALFAMLELLYAINNGLK